MSTSRIRTTGIRGQPTPSHIFADHDWVREHEDELLRKYGECHLIVYHQQVLGTGKSRQDAVEDAERNLPSDIGEIEVMIDWIGNPFSVYFVSSSTSVANDESN